MILVHINDSSSYKYTSSTSSFPNKSTVLYDYSPFKVKSNNSLSYLTFEFHIVRLSKQPVVSIVHKIIFIFIISVFNTMKFKYTIVSYYTLLLVTKYHTVHFHRFSRNNFLTICSSNVLFVLHFSLNLYFEQSLKI